MPKFHLVIIIVVFTNLYCPTSFALPNELDQIDMIIQMEEAFFNKTSHNVHCQWIGREQCYEGLVKLMQIEQDFPIVGQDVIMTNTFDNVYFQDVDIDQDLWLNTDIWLDYKAPPAVMLAHFKKLNDNFKQLYEHRKTKQINQRELHSVVKLFYSTTGFQISCDISVSDGQCLKGAKTLLKSVPTTLIQQNINITNQVYGLPYDSSTICVNFSDNPQEMITYLATKLGLPLSDYLELR
ncbi:MAG: hypothetical protein ISR65_15725 [Bacteriovoracaceae bacterium]|nr:hypothetical protein [Bacteriovoracaceae bacterium]